MPICEKFATNVSFGCPKVTAKPDRAIVAQCADPQLRIGSLFRHDPDGGVLAWFQETHVYPCLNARAAIIKACELLGLGAGDEVLAPSYNCGSEIEPLLHRGSKVLLYRVDLQTNIDLDDIERRISRATRAVYVSHYFGIPQPRIAELRALCDRHNLYLIEDCALALFAEINGRKVGTFGDAAVFCFYKFFPVSSGGALVVNNGKLAAAPAFSRRGPAGMTWKPLARAVLAQVAGPGFLRRMARTRHEASTTANQASLPDMPKSYYYNPAFENAGMTAAAACALRSYSVSETIKARLGNYRAYAELLVQEQGLDFLLPALPQGAVPLAFPVLVKQRDWLVAELNRLGIAVTPWWKGYHQGVDWTGFPETRMLKDNLLSLPVHQSLGRRHVAYICRQLMALLSGARQVSNGAGNAH